MASILMMFTLDLDLQFQALLDLALREEGEYDVTSEALFTKGNVKEGVFMSRGDGVICGLKFLQKIAETIDPSLVVEPFLDEGDAVNSRCH